MAFWGDYHTHTVYSHGKGTIEENVIQAIKMGFKEIAITDHGFKHFTYNVRRMDWPVMQKDAELVRKKYPQIKVFLGLETNLISHSGTADVTHEDIEILDVTVCGYHKFVKSNKFSDFWTFFIPNFFCGSAEKSTKKMIVKNTDAYLNLLERYDIDVISHINYGITADAIEVAKACKHYGTFVELNGKKVSMQDSDIEKMAEMGIEFLVNSDAHSVGRVGDFSVPLKVVDRLGIPYTQLANWEKIPHFRSRIKKGLYED